MRPQQVVSPRAHIQSDSVEVIYTAADTTWSVAEIIYDNEPRLAMRWNGAIDCEFDPGFPVDRGRGAWFVLPAPVEDAIRKLITELGE